MFALLRRAWVGLLLTGLAACTLERAGLGAPLYEVHGGGLPDDGPASGPLEDPAPDAGHWPDQDGESADSTADAGLTPGDAGSSEPAGDAGSDAAGPVPFVLTSPALDASGVLSDSYTCFGGGMSPPLAWSPVPGAASYAIVLRQLDASGAPSQVLWALWDIPSTYGMLPADLGESATPFAEAKQVSGAAARFGLYFQPPCPISTSDVEFTLYALGVASLAGASTWQAPLQVASRIESSGSVIAEARLVATVVRP